MFDVLQSSFPLRASIAAILALLTAGLLFAAVYGLIRLASPKVKKGSRPDPIQGPQESLDRRRTDDTI